MMFDETEQSISTPYTGTRRDLLKRSASGFGYLALASMLAEGGIAHADPVNGPVSEVRTHFAPKAKRIIFMFMKGGPSQMDTFEYKPQLQKDHGKEYPFEKPRVLATKTETLLASPWKFQQHGECGKYVSELFPHVAEHVDDICFLHSLHGNNQAHGPAILKMHTGSDIFRRPSMGAWVNYGLGTENKNLPGFITICPPLAHGGFKNYSSAFLPASYAGIPLGHSALPSEQAQVKFINNQNLSRKEQRAQLDLLQQMNRQHLERIGPESTLEARAESFELAFRMQSEMPEAMDLSQETKETFQMYGLEKYSTNDFGRQCLMARRLAERGVRFIQVTHSKGKVQWDQHDNLKKEHARNAQEVDKPIAALIQDLKNRDLLKDTLLVWGGEFGRTPTVQNEDGKKDGRAHNPEGFTMWLAGGGVKGGLSYGATDDYGYYATVDKMHLHDFHATLLYALGIDHTKLTFRHAGRDFRLTDVAGNIVHDIFT